MTHTKDRGPVFKFSGGNIYLTPGTHELYGAHGVEVNSCLERHFRGDWGDLCDEDKQSNEAALEHGARLMSSYDIEGTTIWIITEADHSSTTVLLPDEY